MKFRASYVREQQRYTKKDLQKLFAFTPAENEGFIRLLKSYGILKAVKNSPRQADLTELADADLEYVDVSAEDGACRYVFTYVGVIIAGSRVIKCCPKYLTLTGEPVSEMKQVLQVLQKYASKEQIVNLYDGSDQAAGFNLLAVMLFLLMDYHENGLYTNPEEIVERNGEGEILWEKTVNEGFPIIRGGKPYYTEYFTRKTADDMTDYFLRLHRCVVSECSRQLEDADLLSLFGLPDANLCNDPLSGFGETDYILYRLQNELNVQFNTRKQLLLKTLYAYIANQQTLSHSGGISMYGTTAFHLVWEDVCASVFSNHLQTPLGQLPVALAEGYDKHARLITLIEAPKWIGADPDGRRFIKTASDTLIPDIIHVTADCFTILDAKYYCPQIEKDKPLRGQPGVGDIVKQYPYQLAFGGFIKDHKIGRVKNCFVLPAESDRVISLGKAAMDILSSIPLQDIQVRKVPAPVLFDRYLQNATLDVSYLEI